MIACSAPRACKGTMTFGTCPIYAYEKLPVAVGSLNGW